MKVAAALAALFLGSGDAYTVGIVGGGVVSFFPQYLGCNEQGF
jgi:hypothetical protein